MLKQYILFLSYCFCLLTNSSFADDSIALNFDPQVNFQISDSTRQQDSNILICGLFNKVNGFPRRGIARSSAGNGRLDALFSPNVSGSITSILDDANGRILCAGSIYDVNGVEHNNIARLNSDGSIDTSFLIPDVDSSILSMAIQDDGKILIGGFFERVDGVARNIVARLNANGTLDTGFDPDIGGAFGSSVNVIVVQDNGKVLLGGRFTEVGGATLTRTSLARFNSNGTLDTGFNPILARSVGTTPKVSSIAIQNDNKILVGGLFDSVTGTARQNFVRLNSSGTLDTGFDVSADGDVLEIVVQRDEKIMLGGSFQMIGDVLRTNLARMEKNGVLDQNFNPRLDGFVTTITQITTSDNFIGGSFDRVNGLDRSNSVRLIFRQDDEICFPINIAAGGLAVVCL